MTARQIHTVCVAVGLLLVGCSADRPIESSPLRATNGTTYNFPGDLRGRVVVVSFIYTHCPDICRMTIGHLLDTWERIEGDTSIVFATVTLDPARDSLNVLRQYAEVWGISSPRWLLLTGTVANVERVHRVFGVVARKSYTERLPDGQEVYFIDHTDAVFILDRNGIVRDRREGSTLDPAEYAKIVQRYASVR